MKTLVRISICGLFAAAAHGQSFNIDINNTSGTGSGVPSAGFGGAAGQPGTWNNINSGTPLSTTLADLNGNATSVAFSRSASSSFFSNNNTNTSGDFEKLMDDVQRNAGGNLTYTVSGLTGGLYAVYTYGIEAGSCIPEQCVVTISGASGDDLQVLSCNLDAAHANKFTRGATHSLHLINVASGGGFSAVIAPDFGPSACAGMQLVRVLNSRHRIYVNDNAGGDNIGTSWEDAYTDLQVALADADVGGAMVTEIWTAQGFYRPTAGTLRTISFVIPSGLRLYGGFVGTETSLTQRTQPAFYITAMTGSISGGNSHTVVKADNTSTATLVDGFSIANGNNSGSGSNGDGGGLRVINGSPVFRNCKFLSNSAGTNGGGVYSSGGSPRFVDCLFYNNEVSNGEGGAVYHTTPDGTFGDIDFFNCKFDRNYSQAGGALKISFASGDIYNCWFNGNTAGTRAAAIYIAGAAQLTRIGNCTITNNSSAQLYGGIYINEGVGSPTNVGIYNTILWGNTDTTSASPQNENIVRSGAGTLALAYDTIEGWTGTLGGTGNNGVNPQFVDLNGTDNIIGNADDNPRLVSSSPMCDSGVNNNVLSDVPDLDQDGNTSERLPLDYDGNTRFVNNPSVADTGVGTPPLVDRGCFEFNFRLGDVDCDNNVNVLDVADFIQALLDPAQYSTNHPLCSITLADLNGDGLIDADAVGPFVNCVIAGSCP